MKWNIIFITYVMFIYLNYFCLLSCYLNLFIIIYGFCKRCRFYVRFEILWIFCIYRLVHHRNLRFFIRVYIFYEWMITFNVLCLMIVLRTSFWSIYEWVFRSLINIYYPIFISFKQALLMISVKVKLLIVRWPKDLVIMV